MNTSIITEAFTTAAAEIDASALPATEKAMAHDALEKRRTDLLAAIESGKERRIAIRIENISESGIVSQIPYGAQPIFTACRTTIEQAA